MKACSMCHGTGHDKGSRPVIVFTDYIDEKGRKRRRHTTKSIGSGCMKCQGTGNDHDPAADGVY